MFKTVGTRPGRQIVIEVNGKAVTCSENENLAAVLLRSDFMPFRKTPVSASPRAPYCMMGVCFECLATVDHVPNQQACMLVSREGMQVKMQEGGFDPEELGHVDNA